MKILNLYTNRFCRFAMVAIAIVLMFGSNVFAQGGKPAASLEQIRNGSATDPVDPAQWQNGNAGNQTAHYVEGHSIGYRALLSNLPVNTTVTLTLGYDIRHSSKNAIDFLTHYDRLQPHGQFTTGGKHPAQELVDPRLGTSFVNQSPTSTYEIPSPPSNISGVPASAWTAIKTSNAEKVKMTMWGGTITKIDYVEPTASLTDAQSEQRVIVTFTTGSSGAAVLAWGGHIASRQDWGFEDGVPLSAGGISGSPYHMRLKDWTLGNLGNQDRSLSASAVIAPPGCALTGFDDVCAGSSNVYSTTEVADSYAWTLINNTSGATFATAPTSTSTSVTVNAGASGGSYTVKLVTTRNGIVSTDVCEIVVRVYKVDKPRFTIQDASLCGSATASITICDPIVGVKYIVTQDAGGAAAQEVTYSGSDPLVFSNLIPGKNVYIAASVSADGGSICSASSDCNDKVASCTPIEPGVIESESSSSLKGVEPADEDNVTAYPVPFRDRATVNFKSLRSGNYVINLYDLKGQLVKELKSGKTKAGELQNIEVDGRSLPDGMYLIRVVDASGARTVKVLKKE